jgi:hypothetical protein
MSLFGKKEPKPEPPVVAQPRPAPPAKPRFGIDEAISLFKTLPVDQNTSLVVLVIKNTLASLDVDVQQVIADGSQKQERLRAQITDLRASIAELERQADIHRAEIATVEVDLAETTAAKDRLELAQRGEPIAPAPPPPRNRSVKPSSFPKPPPRTPNLEPAKAEPRAAAPEPSEPTDGPESDLLAMLPDSSSERET